MAFHLEPYEGRTAQSVVEDVKYLTDKYGSHPAVLRTKKVILMSDNAATMHDPSGKPLFFVYDSYHIPASDWAAVLATGSSGAGSIRDLGVFIGLVLHAHHEQDVHAAGFDGGYSYFATDGFSFGSTSINWPNMTARMSREQNQVFVPSVSPGYDDMKIRPWNMQNRRERNHGKYYDETWNRAIASGATIVTITSYNEWGEGTQIEPALPHLVPYYAGVGMEFRKMMGLGQKYQDYGVDGPNKYLNMTLAYSREYHLVLSGKKPRVVVAGKSKTRAKVKATPKPTPTPTRKPAVRDDDDEDEDEDEL